MIVAAFEEWFQNTNGYMAKEFLFDDLWARFQPLIQNWETKGYQVCGASEDGATLVFRDQMNRGMRLTEFKNGEFQSLQYVEDVDSHDWTVYVSEVSTRTSGFLRTQAWCRNGLKRTAYREFTNGSDINPASDTSAVAADSMFRDVVLTMAEEEGIRLETLEACSIAEIEERISIAHMRPQLAVFGQE
jgi:hypothetical protein